MQLQLEPLTAARREPSARTIELNDGSKVLIRPLTGADRAALLNVFDHLSADSRYGRFFTGKPALSEHELAYLSDVDHWSHEALIAFDHVSGEPVAVGRFIRCKDDPECAEVALSVIDRWQGRGLGTALMRCLSRRARRAGIRRLRFLVLAENRRMRELLKDLGPGQPDSLDQGTLEFSLEIGEQETDERIRALLRHAACDAVQLLHPRLPHKGHGSTAAKS